jgi:hypothetical protein
MVHCVFSTKKRATETKNPNTRRHWGKQNEKSSLTFHPPPYRRQFPFRADALTCESSVIFLYAEK